MYVLVSSYSGFFLEILLRGGGGIEIAVCEGGHTCVSVFCLKHTVLNKISKGKDGTTILLELLQSM